MYLQKHASLGQFHETLPFTFFPDELRKGNFDWIKFQNIKYHLLTSWCSSKWWISHFEMHSVWQQLRSAVANCQVQMIYSIINNHKYYREFLWDTGTRSGAGGRGLGRVWGADWDRTDWDWTGATGGIIFFSTIPIFLLFSVLEVSNLSKIW